MFYLFNYSSHSYCRVDPPYCWGYPCMAAVALEITNFCGCFLLCACALGLAVPLPLAVSLPVAVPVPLLVLLVMLKYRLTISRRQVLRIFSCCWVKENEQGNLQPTTTLARRPAFYVYNCCSSICTYTLTYMYMFAFSLSSL